MKEIRGLMIADLVGASAPESAAFSLASNSPISSSCKDYKSNDRCNVRAAAHTKVDRSKAKRLAVFGGQLRV
jgi:hypothetical protein